MTATLPRNWAWVEIEGLVATPSDLTDGPFGSNLKTEHYTESGAIVIRLQNIGDGSFVDEKAFISREHFERLRKHEARSGDVVVAMLGNDLPRACLVPSTLGPAIVKADCVRLRPNPGLVDSRYVAAGLNSAVVRSQAKELVHGVGRPRLGLKWFRTLRLPVAPPAEQARIVEALDSYLSRLDAAVASLERVQSKLRLYRASVLKAAVEGRLVPTEAELARQEQRDYEPASVLLERILEERRRRWEEAELARLQKAGKAPKDDKWKAKYKEPVAPDQNAIELLPPPPDGWCYASMDQLTSAITSGSRDWSRYYGSGTGVFLMAQNVRPMQLDLSYRQLVDPPSEDSSRDRSQVYPGDLLVTIVGANTGDVCSVRQDLPEHFVCQSVALMRPVDVRISEYLLWFLNSPDGRRIYSAYMYGEGRPHLSFDQLRATPILLPPLIEAERLVQACEFADSETVNTADIVDTSMKRIRRLRQAVLKWAFEGKLVDQDPADEPAEKLLERIRAERAAAAPATKARGRKAKAAS